MRPVKKSELTVVPLAHLRGGGTVARRAWRATYVRRLVAGDALCALAATIAGGWLHAGAATGVSLLVTICAPVAWVATMSVVRGYEQRFLWDSPEEFRRVLLAAVTLLAALATVSWVLRLETTRDVLLALPLACLLTLVQRYGQRTRLRHQRARGRFLHTTLLVGHRAGVAAMNAQLRRETEHGYRVIGCCLPFTNARTFDGLPVLGCLEQVVDVVVAHEVDTVAVLPAPELDAGVLRRLGWQLQDTHAELLMAPAVTELAGPRVRVRPSLGLPLLHVEVPELRGARRLAKEVFDRTTALVAIIVMLPALLAIAVAIKATSSGPALTREERLGRGGRTFGLLRFRSAVAEARPVPVRRNGRDGAEGVLLTLHREPPATAIGRFLRQHSLDELPQLVNVLRGEMSLVGPRPPLPRDPDRHGAGPRRQLLVKPGLTGLRELSGRSNLSPDDLVRMEVRYLENWSLGLDLVILARTLASAVRRARGR